MLQRMSKKGDWRGTTPRGLETAQNAAQQGAMTVLDADQNLPWSEFRDQLADTDGAWWAEQATEYLDWFGDANGEYGSYQRDADADSSLAGRERANLLRDMMTG